MPERVTSLDVGNGETALGAQLADDLRVMVVEADAEHERSLQTDLGPSEIGDPCARCLARKILGLPEEPSDPWCRILGTAGHGWLDEAAARFNVRHDTVRYLPERRVYPHPSMGSGGSSDLYDVARRCVIDHKIVGNPTLARVRKSGPSHQYRVQIQTYGLGYSNAGVEVDHVAIAYWKRGGRIDDLFVHTEPYDPSIALEAIARYEAMRDLVLPLGAAVLDQLPSDPDCYECQRSKPWKPSADFAEQSLDDLWSSITNEEETSK